MRSQVSLRIIAIALSDLRLERAIRAWASHDAATREVYKRVDAARISFLVKSLAGVGWDEEWAHALGQWAYCAWVGFATLGDMACTERQLGRILSLLLPKQAAVPPAGAKKNGPEIAF